jgi:inosine/xanthosine triphosphate pyrophosphatase family protein
MFQKPGKIKETKMMTEKKKMEVREHNKKLDNVQIIKFDMQDIKTKIENIKTKYNADFELSNLQIK